MPEKLIQEEQQKIISSKDYLDKLRRLQVIDPILEDIKNKAMSNIDMLFIPMGQTLASLQEAKKEIQQRYKDKTLDDLYEIDPITQYVKQFIRDSDNMKIHQEQIIQTLIGSFHNFIDKLNMVGINPKVRATHLREGETIMKEDEKKALEMKASKFVMAYHSSGIAKQKGILASLWREYGKNEQAFYIFDDVFYKITGRHEFEAYKKKKEEEGMVE